MSGYQVDLGGQYYTTLISLLVGGALCLLYDVFRIVRMARRWSGIAVFFQDVMYCAVVSAVTYGMLLVRCSGVVRIYPLAGELCGFAVCRFTVSRLVMSAAKFIISAVKKVVAVVNKVIFAPVLHFFGSIFAKIFTFAKKINYLLKNYLKETSVMVYNHVKLHRGGKCDEGEQ